MAQGREMRTGVWIDHRQAVVATAGAAAADGIRGITTDLERQLRLSSGERAKTSYGPQVAPSDDMRETSSKTNLKSFYNEVLATVRGSPAIFIFGPGEAKEEFKKHLEQNELGDRIDGVEPVGKMTDRQILAKIREHFRPRG